MIGLSLGMGRLRKAGAAASASPIVDQLAGTVVIALSSRKLRAAYAGSAMQVQRTNDNATQDIGFASGNLDTGSLASFVGSNTAYNIKWYDQSGNANNATGSAGTNNNPQVVNAGTNNAINSRVAGLWVNSTSSILAFAGALTFSQPITIAACFKYTSAHKAHLFDGFGGADRILFGDSSGAYQLYAGTAITGGSDDTSLHTGIAVFNGATSNLYIDGTQIITNQNVGSQTWGDGGNPEVIGQGQGGGSIDGYITEVIVMNSVMSAGDRALIRSSWQSYWGAP